jgi:hypothetical protein
MAPRPLRPVAALAALVLAALGPSFGWCPPAGAAPVAPDPARGPVAATEVKVERIRPRREKLPTLRFLKDNRAFFRARLDLLRATPVDRRNGAEAIDPRFLAYPDMLAAIGATRDSVAAAEEARKARELFASIHDLGDLESQLDRLEHALADQRTRLGVLQQDFVGLQRTALAIVVSGYPRAAEVSSVAITLEDGATTTVPISAEQRDALRRGGVLQIFHGLVEPRPQVLELGLGGDHGAMPDSAFVTLEPPRDRLTLLRLDLSPVQPAAGATGILASTWLQDVEPRGSGSSRIGP